MFKGLLIALPASALLWWLLIRHLGPLLAEIEAGLRALPLG